DRDEPRQRVQQGGLAAAVRAEHRHRLAGLDCQLDVELEGAAPEADARLEAHGASSQRPRMMTRIVSDTASSTRLSARPASGRFSSWTWTASGIVCVGPGVVEAQGVEAPD